jgi:hypothetical protein
VRERVATGLLLVTALTAGLVAAPGTSALPGDDVGPRRVLGTRPVPTPVPGAAKAFVLRYTTRSVGDRVVPATGLVLVPEGRRPRGGWPLVVYGHMTTGTADRCAPTSPHVPRGEDRRMARQGDDLARALLAAGVVVVRPDYEGLGVPGGHPYLQGRSLGRSMVDMVAATRRVLPLAGDWVAVGHSEGGVAALNVGDRRRRLVPGMRLRGISAITPVTRMELLVRALQGVPVAVPQVTPQLVGLAALLLKGLAVADPEFRRLVLHHGGLSDRARALWPDLESRCLAGVSAADSWGGLAPGELLGPRGDQAAAALRHNLRRTDVRRLPMRDVPVRIDLGLLDLVAPAPLSESLVRDYRRAGLDVTVGRWPSGHSPTNSDEFAVPAVTAWILARLSVER